MSIARLTTTFAFSLLAAQLASGVAAAACPNPPNTTHELKFKLKSNDCVEQVMKKDGITPAPEIKVCKGDKVEWKVSGKDKKIVFDNDSPFDWKDSGHKSNKIEGTVKAVVTESTTFKYTVFVKGLENVPGCPLDPKIIVEP